ncbi:MAG: AAA family ATPase [Candidatus Lokiarchaeota archaeon]|nr:AAA family ATPase [Candidatus Lokiarchaeota archaeon]
MALAQLEQELFACFFRKPHTIMDVSQLKEECFTDVGWRLYAGLLDAVIERGADVNLRARAFQLFQNDKPSLVYLSDIFETSLMPAKDDEHIEIASLLREQGNVTLSRKIAQQLFDENITPQQAQAALNDLLTENQDGIRSYSDNASAVQKLISKYHDRDFGPMTGFSDIDKEMNGFEEGTVTVLAGRPSMGKSTVAMNIADNVAKGGTPVLVFSLEMTAEQWHLRSICSRLPYGVKYTGKDLRQGNVDPQDEGLQEAIRITNDLPVYLDDRRGITIDDIASTVSQAQSRFGIGLVVIDWLGFIVPPKFNDQRIAIEYVSRRLVELAGNRRIPILLLHQLSRKIEDRGKTSIQNRRPRLSDLRESGAIEQDAEKVLFVFRPEVYEIDAWTDGTDTRDTIEIALEKNRNGSLTRKVLRFDKDYSRLHLIERKEAF